MAKGKSDSNVKPPNGDGSNAGGNASENSGVAGSNAGGNNGGIIDPATLTTGSANINPDTGKRKYTRRGNTAAPQAVQIDLGITDTLLYTCHMMLAQYTGIKEIALTGEECGQLAEKIRNLTGTLAVTSSPRTKAVVELCMVAGSIYGPRIVGGMFFSEKKSNAGSAAPSQ
jgi:hypothetical protein